MVESGKPNRLVRFLGTPRRRLYTGRNLDRVQSVEDLRARAHKLMPGFVLEYLEGGAGEEATLARDRAAFADWRFVPRQLVDVSHRSLACDVLGRPSALPLAVAPTGLNGLFCRRGDILLAEGAAKAGVPFAQSTMSNERMEDVAKVEGLRHWWQLYVFGPDEIWQELLRRAEACGVEAVLLTTNAQLFGRRSWDNRDRYADSLPTIATVVDAALHPHWVGTTLDRGMPVFKNVIDFIPKAKRGFFESAYWIREQMPTSLSWDHVARIRQRWNKPLLLKGLLHPADVRRACDSGVDGVILGTHGGRQADWSVSALDVLPVAREVVGDRFTLMLSGGIRHGTDLLKALALGADAVVAGRAPLYGLCAAGAEGVARSIAIIRDEALNAMAQYGAPTREHLRALMVRAGASPRPDMANMTRSSS